MASRQATEVQAIQEVGNCHPGPTTVQNTLSILGWTHMAVTTNNVAFFYNSANGQAASARLNPDGSLTVLQKFPDEATGNGAFDPGAALITPGPNNYFVLLLGVIAPLLTDLPHG